MSRARRTAHFPARFLDIAHHCFRVIAEITLLDDRYGVLEQGAVDSLLHMARQVAFFRTSSAMVYDFPRCLQIHLSAQEIGDYQVQRPLHPRYDARFLDIDKLDAPAGWAGANNHTSRADR